MDITAKVHAHREVKTAINKGEAGKGRFPARMKVNGLKETTKRGGK